MNSDNELTLNKELELIKELKAAIVNFDSQNIESLCQKYLSSGYNVNKAVFEGLIPGMMEVSRLYEEQTYFIPEMLMCSDTLYLSLQIFQPEMTCNIERTNQSILIGVVEGDIHDIGKNLVKMMLEVAGYKVTDLGRDVPLQLFLEKALEKDFDLICMSSMMSTTAYEMRLLIHELKAKKPLQKIMIGGAPVTPLDAINWKADAYAPDAQKALLVVHNLLNTLTYLTLGGSTNGD